MLLTTTPNSFLTESLTLIRARPSTVKITTSYHQASSTDPPSTNPPKSKKKPAKKSTLTLKCYDPVSGACIKFRTNKIADVGRLIGALSKAARGMAGLPVTAESSTTSGVTAAATGGNLDNGKDAVMTGTPLTTAIATKNTSSTKKAEPSTAPQSQSQTGGGGKGGKKKKGKK